jgi:hypothetical protein
MINVVCPNPDCGRTLRMSEKFVGKKVGCVHCAQPFLVEEAPLLEQVTSDLAPQATTTVDLLGASGATQAASASLLPLPDPEEARRPPPLPLQPREVGAGLLIAPLLVSLLSIAVTVGSLGGIAWLLRGKPAVTPEEPGERWAAISIESKGVRLLIVDAKRGDGNPSFLPREMVNRDWSAAMPKPLPVDPPQEVANLGTILTGMNELLDRYDVPREHRLIGCTNGLLKDVEERDRQRAQKWLAGAVWDKLGLKLEVIDAGLEAEYGARASIARKHRTTSLYLDVGTNGTKYGYFEDAANFRGASDKLGGKLAVAEIDALRKAGKAGVAEAAEKWKPTGDNAVTALTLKTPKLKNAERYYLGGGAAWATAVLTHPDSFRPAENQRPVLVEPLTAADIDEALKLAKAHETGDALKLAVLAKAPSPHGHLSEELDRINNQFTPEQLVARITLLKCFADACGFGGERKQAVFFTGGLYSWPLGHIAVKGGFEK